MGLAALHRDVEAALNVASEYCDCPAKTKHLLMCRLSRRIGEPVDLGGNTDGHGSHSSMSKRSRRSHQVAAKAEGEEVNSDYEERKFRERSPCRRTCSTTHHPMHHCGRFNLKLKRGRPGSAADMTPEQKEAAMLKQDWQRSEMFA